MFIVQLIQPDSVHIDFCDFIHFSQVYQWVQKNNTFSTSSFNPLHKVKVNIFPYGPEQALKDPGGWDFQNF